MKEGYCYCLQIIHGYEHFNLHFRCGVSLVRLKSELTCWKLVGREHKKNHISRMALKHNSLRGSFKNCKRLGAEELEVSRSGYGCRPPATLKGCSAATRKARQRRIRREQTAQRKSSSARGAFKAGVCGLRPRPASGPPLRAATPRWAEGKQ